MYVFMYDQQWSRMTCSFPPRSSAASAGCEWGGQVSKMMITGRAANLLCNLCHGCNQAAAARAAAEAVAERRNI